MPDDVTYISAAQFRLMLGIGASTLEKMRVEGKLPPSIKIGALRKWNLATVRRWLAEVHAEAAQPA